MTTGSYCYFRNGYEYLEHPFGDRGRMGYRRDRAELETWTHSGPGLSRLWFMQDYGPVELGHTSKRMVTLAAVDTAVPGMPANPDKYAYWAHAPLLLGAFQGGEVRLTGTGPDLMDEINVCWIAESLMLPLPNGQGQGVAMRFESWAFRGKRLSHERRALIGPGQSMPASDGRLMVHADDAPGAARDSLWWMETAQPPAHAGPGAPSRTGTAGLDYEAARTRP
ncbi:hypothetical protein [Phenylobacterium sp. J367]|uniref:hypothetical protein n=1 Tax=Phenylobacterium sp. J367 TaxID=2898435 RepID=UPI0021515409|nr:hypothetical protein [Phenylobacterium sp. J367]MCR5879016.1 hypothetical protein [Phenylobacterium sp. J367]